MTVVVRLRDIEDGEALRGNIERRVDFATDRFGERLTEVHVVVSDINGPRGGIDKHCSIRGVLEGGRSITVEERGANAIAVVNRAVRRLGRSVSRTLVRVRRGRISLPSPFEARVA